MVPILNTFDGLLSKFKLYLILLNFRSFLSLFLCVLIFNKHTFSYHPSNLNFTWFCLTTDMACIGAFYHCFYMYVFLTFNKHTFNGHLSIFKFYLMFLTSEKVWANAFCHQGTRVTLQGHPSKFKFYLMLLNLRYVTVLSDTVSLCSNL